MTKITINITKEEKKHLKDCSSELDACEYVSNIITKIKIKLGIKK